MKTARSSGWQARCRTSPTASAQAVGGGAVDRATRRWSPRDSSPSSALIEEVETRRYRHLLGRRRPSEPRCDQARHTSTGASAGGLSAPVQSRVGRLETRRHGDPRALAPLAGCAGAPQRGSVRGFTVSQPEKGSILMACIITTCRWSSTSSPTRSTGAAGGSPSGSAATAGAIIARSRGYRAEETAPLCPRLWRVPQPLHRPPLHLSPPDGRGRRGRGARGGGVPAHQPEPAGSLDAAPGAVAVEAGPGIARPGPRRLGCAHRSYGPATEVLSAGVGPAYPPII